MSETMISAEIRVLPNMANQAALAMQRLGFRIRHIGLTVSVEGPQSSWESIFNVSFETRKKTVIREVNGGEVAYQKALTEDVRIPAELKPFIQEVLFQEPPEFY